VDLRLHNFKAYNPWTIMITGTFMTV